MQHLGPYLLAFGLLVAGIVTISGSKVESDTIAKIYRDKGHEVAANIFGGCFHRAVLIILGIIFISCSIFVFYGIVLKWMHL